MTRSRTFVSGAVESFGKKNKECLALSMRPLRAIWLSISKDMNTRVSFSNIFGIKKERFYFYIFFIRLLLDYCHL